MQGRPQAAGEKAQARLSPLPEPTVWTRGFATVHLCARASRRVCICKISCAQVHVHVVVSACS